MAVENSTNWVALHDTVQVDNLTNVNMTVNAETIDVTNKDSAGWRSLIAGTKSASGSYEAHFEKAATQGFEEAYDDLVAGSSVTLKHQEGAATGDVSYSFTALITSVEKSGGVEEGLSYTVNWEATGAPTKATVI
jgi:predicted secreted protein